MNYEKMICEELHEINKRFQALIDVIKEDINSKKQKEQLNIVKELEKKTQVKHVMLDGSKEK